MTKDGLVDGVKNDREIAKRDFSRRIIEVEAERAKREIERLNPENVRPPRGGSR